MSAVQSEDEAPSDEEGSQGPEHAAAMATLSIVSGAHTIGKTAQTNEDAFFVAGERGFGIADGVSGWIEFGFSSDDFSKQLMVNCQLEIERFDAQKRERME